MTSAPAAHLPPGLAEETASLVRRGEHARAADLLREAGFPADAARLYEHIFERARAMDAYEAAGDLVAAVRVAVDVADAARLDALVSRAIALGQGDALLGALTRSGRDAEVARVHAARGDLAAAARAYERAGMLDRAAQCLEDSGRARDAGLLLERHLEAYPEDAQSMWRLGQIVARFGRHDDAIALLQRSIRAAPEPDVMLARAAPVLMVSFIQLGYEHAARSVLARWQAACARAAKAASSASVLPLPPDSFEAFVSSERAAALAALQSAPLASSEGSAEAPVFSEPSGDDGILLAGRYLLGEPLGGGGVGQVFRAFDAFADTPVAVRILGAQVLASDAVRDYAREVRAFAALHHPAMAELVELNMAHGFVVTELVDARPLEERLSHGGAAHWVLAATHALLDLLACAHRVGLVHGGLKPTNIFLMPGGVRVVDAGAHRLLALRSTETGGLSSVWPYLAPEQLFGAPASTTSDLYAVAAILYRAFTGRAPFSRAEEDRRQAPPPASSLEQSVPPAWDAFFHKALHPVADQRFRDAAEMSSALPTVPPDHVLPSALLVAQGARDAVRLTSHSARYARGGLVQRELEGAVRFFEGSDMALTRPVWLVDADDVAHLGPLMACARLGRGVQPIYDVLADERRVVVARDLDARVADLAALRSVPQGLARDLAGVARALDAVHAQGWAVGGFPVARAFGPVGPRLTIAPAPLFTAASAEAVTRDWRAFEAVVCHAFDLDEQADVDARSQLLQALSDRRVLDRVDVEALGRDMSNTPWPLFLDALSQRLVLGASSRVVARLVAKVLRG